MMQEARDNPYASPRNKVEATSTKSSVFRATILMRGLRDLLARAFIAAMLVASPVALTVGLISRKGLTHSDDPYLVGMFLGGLAAIYCAIDCVFGLVPWSQWLRNLLSAAIVAAWFASLIYADTQAKEGQGIATILAFLSSLSAAGGLVSSRVRLRRWFAWPVGVITALFALGLMVAQWNIG